MLKVGLTGGIASGKSHVLRRLAAAGFQTVDLDAVAREVMAPGGSAYGDVASTFGARILAGDGTIDRKALGELVFADAAARRRLEALVHPRIRQEESRHLSSAAPGSVAVVDAALLVESGQHLRFHRLVVVFCEPEEQLRRLMARDGLSESAARARLGAQMPPAEKKRFGHFVIDNSRDVKATDAQVDALIAALRTLAAAHVPRIDISVDHVARAMTVGPRRGPRGLHPARLLEEIASSGAMDMARMAGLLVPPHDGPWLGAPSTADEAPETLALVAALWSAAERPGDVPFATAAAASLSRLTHRDPAVVSGAVLAALAAAHVLTTGEASSLAIGLPEWVAAATAWTGSPPPDSTLVTVRAAARHAGDGDAASREAAAGGGIPDLARALAGGAEAVPIDPQLRARVARVLGRGAE